jgi:uncharacterized protein (DUF2252 family)
VRIYANLLGEADATELLNQTLEEEKETDRKLTSLAGKSNVEASAQEGQEDSQSAGAKREGKSLTARKRSDGNREHEIERQSSGRHLLRSSGCFILWIEYENKSSNLQTLDAPSWLWASVIELVTSHESAYLEHCRQYAIDAA